MSSRKRPFIVTGPSASGKTTLVHGAVASGYEFLPTHMTRRPRASESDGVDLVSLTPEEFTDNFNKGVYIEPSLGFALLSSTGVYYGTPRSWVEIFDNDNPSCATPVSIAVANQLVSKCVSKPLWVHLDCPEESRRGRLRLRGIQPEEIEARVSGGDSINVPELADMVFDTSHVSVETITEKIMKE